MRRAVKRRLDVFEFIAICDALGISASKIVSEFKKNSDPEAA